MENAERPDLHQGTQHLPHVGLALVAADSLRLALRDSRESDTTRAAMAWAQSMDPVWLVSFSMS